MSDSSESRREAFRLAVRLIDAQRRLLQDAGVREGVSEALAEIIRHLHRLPTSQVDRLCGIRNAEPSKAKLERAIVSAETLSLPEVEKAIERDDVPRMELEAIAIGRFHVPRGSMRSLGNRERLRDKLRTFVQNERTHETISEVAKNTR